MPRLNWSRLAALIHLPVSPTKCHISLVGWYTCPGAEPSAHGCSHGLPQITVIVACHVPPQHPHFISEKPHKVTFTHSAHWDDGPGDGHPLSFPQAGTGDSLLSSDNRHPGHNPLTKCTLLGPVSLEGCCTSAVPSLGGTGFPPAPAAAPASTHSHTHVVSTHLLN